MRKFKAFSKTLILVCFFFACEKDDICVEGDTAQLVIRFYDIDDPTELKAVTGLRVSGLDQDDTVDTFTDRTELDSIAIPLNPTTDISEFIFITDSADDDDGLEEGNSDNISFSYVVQEEFIGRACGFIAKFDELSSTTTADTENWIQSVEITKAIVQTEDTLTAHVKIFH